jgi:hypothetical protein
MRRLVTSIGFELRLTVGGEMPRSQVCVTQEDLIVVEAEWCAALEAKGWTRRSGGAPFAVTHIALGSSSGAQNQVDVERRARHVCEDPLGHSVNTELLGRS